MVVWHAPYGRQRIFPSPRHGLFCFNSRSDLMIGPASEREILQSPLFHQRIVKYVLFRQQGTASRSLRMTCKSQLSDHNAGTIIHLSYKIGTDHFSGAMNPDVAKK